MRDLLCLSIEGPSLEEYNAKKDLLIWWTGGQRKRRLQFHAQDCQATEEDEFLNLLHAGGLEADAPMLLVQLH